MAFQSVPSTFEAVVEWSQNGVFAINTFYVEVDPVDYTQATCDALAADVDAWASATLKLAWGSSTVYQQARTRGLANQVDFASTNATNTGVAGTYTTSTPCPNNVAFSMARRSGFTGRTARGRVYLPLHTAMLTPDENLVLPVWEAVARGALDLFRVAVTSTVASAVEVIVSRYLNGALRPTGTTLPVVSYSPANLTVDTMRRRLP